MVVSKIYEGWRNSLAPSKHLAAQIKETKNERIEICKTCPEYSKNNTRGSRMRMDIHCVNCGCTLSAKTACLSCKCPLDKWLAVVSDKENKEMKK
jgi:hypothetical protein